MSLSIGSVRDELHLNLADFISSEYLAEVL